MFRARVRCLYLFRRRSVACACRFFFFLLNVAAFVGVCLVLCYDRDHSVTITHDVKSQKSAEANRYTIDYSAQKSLRDELQKG